MWKWMDRCWFAVLAACLLTVNLYGQNNNGTIDDFAEMFQKRTVHMPTPDGATFATDVFLPITSDSLMVDINIPGVGLVNVELIQKGVQYMTYPTVNGEPNPNPFELPIVFTRTPYNKNGMDILGYVFCLFGYASAIQDIRGLYGSTDIFMPLYTDSWDKTPYSDFIPYNILPDGYTEGGTRNPSTYTDGLYFQDWLLEGWTRPYDVDEDGVIDFEAPAGNGSLLYFGGSALSNAGLQMALARRNVPGQPGLQGFLNIIATAEHWGYSIFNHGSFREALVSNWVFSQIRSYRNNGDVSDTTLYNAIHTPSDYGLDNKEEVLEVMLDLISSEDIDGQTAVYPNGTFRLAYSASRAYVNVAGEGDPAGAYNRYSNMDMPFYHLSGWWDIFNAGQIESWKETRKHISEEGGNRSTQKLIIGPWQHLAPAIQNAGDLTFPPNVGDLLGFTVDIQGSSVIDLILSILNVDVDKLINSELFSFIRFGANYNAYKNIGEPQIRFPANLRYQPIGGDFLLQIPAEEYSITHANLINWLLGLEGLSGFDAKLYTKAGGDTTLLNTFNFNLPALPPIITNIFGDVDEPLTSFPAQLDYSGLPDVRLYICGPVGAGVPDQNRVGNYWMEADTFPVVDGREWNTLYLHSDGSLQPSAPDSAETPVSYIHDPNDPVVTVSGNNLTIMTPNEEPAMGPKDLARAPFINVTMEREGVIAFETAPLEDSLTVIGYPVVTLYAASLPDGAAPGDPTDTDFNVRIVDVYPGGKQPQITEGVVNARARLYAKSIAENAEDDDAPYDNIESGSVYEYTFRLDPMGYSFARNHRVKILISSSNHPRFQSNPNVPIEPNEFFRWSPGDETTYNFEGVEYSPRTAENTIHFAPEYPSRITLPVFGRSIAECGVVAQQSVSSITDTTAWLNWSGASGAHDFIIRYRPAGSPDWIELEPGQASALFLEGLAAGTLYEWQVGSICSDTILYSETVVFESTGVPTYTQDDLARRFSLYPNPVRDRLYISSGEAWNGQLRLLDAAGREVRYWGDILLSERMELDISGVDSGAYLLEFNNGDRSIGALPVIVLGGTGE